MLTRREATGKRRRLFSWGLLVVAGLVAGIFGLSMLSNTAEGQSSPTPNLPTSFVISAITDTGATFTWMAGADGDCATTEYDLEIKGFYSVDEEGNKILSPTATFERVDFSGTSVTATGLRPGTEYRATLGAYGDSCNNYSQRLIKYFKTTGTAPATTPTPAATETPSAEPNSPTGFAASAITDTGVTLTWTAGADGDCATTEYDVTVRVEVPELRTVWFRADFTGTSVTVTGLSRASMYTAHVSAYGSTCDQYSDRVYVRFITTGDPAKPTGLTATGGVQQIALSWTDLSDTTVTRWEYQQKAGNGSYGLWTAIPSSSATTTRHTVTGLAGGTTYAFKVRAVNPAGNSPASDEATARTAPAKPTGVTATGGVRQIALGWADPSDSTITSWEYQQKTGAGSYGAWMAIGSSSATTTAHTVTGLSDGTTYAFKVRAVNASGNGDASDEVTAATTAAKPTGLTATGGVRAAALTWTNPGGASITSWEYQQKAGSGAYGTWMAIGSSSATTTNYTVTGLAAGTVYAFKVRAVNSAGNGPASDEVTARTAPAKPTGVTATAGAQRVVLAWADPGDASITRWEYQQKQGGGAYGSWTAIPGSGATTTTYTVRGLLAETAYAFKVRAVNPAGNGPASDEVTATTPMFVLVPGEETATPTGTPTPTPTATPTPPPGASPTPTPPPGATPTPPPSATPDTGDGDTDDDEPPEPDTGDGDTDDDEPAEPDTGDGDTDDDEPAEPDTGDGDTDDDEPAEPDTGAGDTDDDVPAEPDTGAGGDIADDEPGIGDAGSGLATGGVSLAAISGVIALALALALGRPAWARRRR